MIADTGLKAMFPSSFVQKVRRMSETGALGMPAADSSAASRSTRGVISPLASPSGTSLASLAWTAPGRSWWPPM